MLTTHEQACPEWSRYFKGILVLRYSVTVRSQWTLLLKCGFLSLSFPVYSLVLFTFSEKQVKSKLQNLLRTSWKCFLTLLNQPESLSNFTS
jgi:hypothetical protein